MNYRLLIDYEVIEFLETLPRRDQRLLRNRFMAIQSDPQKFSDYVESDSDSHRLDIHIYGKFAIKFWQDHAGRDIKILDAHFADQPNRRLKENLMKSRPKIGTVGELAFQTEARHAVEFAGNGMPAVLSTPQLIGFIERTARETMAGFLDADERSIGMEIEIRHLAPTLVGGTVHCTARIIQVDDRKVDFQVEARDAHELIARGLHKRAVIRLESFNRRVRAKAG